MPKIQNLIALSRLFEVSIDELLSGEENETNREDKK